MAVRLLKGPFTVADYYHLAESGVLREDDRVELLDGQVVAMTPIGPRHAGCVKYLNAVLFRALRGVATLAVQDPLHLDERSEPQPDLAVVLPRADSYRGRHPNPRDTLLVIEVADTSAAYDREVKIPLYSRAGIPEVWLVDLEADGIEVYREPRDEGYASIRRAARGDTITPMNFPSVTLRVDDILG